jgi:ferredoxin-NADP reductase/MOSC domain-containing protein YiiM
MASIVSINVGRPQHVAWGDRTVETSIWKRPVEGRIQVWKLNLAGDEQADKVGHGGEHRAVMVYQLESYRYWEKFLDRPPFPYGQFGENLTIEGLSDSYVCVGDQYRIGGALFEVTQPRVTCFKVGIKLGHPQMPALLVAHRRPGFYFRVLEEGEIGAGDLIVKIADGPERMSVADIDSLLYTRPRPREALAKAARIPALSKGWRDSFKTYLAEEDAGSRQPSADGVAWKGYRALQIIALKKESEDVLSITFISREGLRLPMPLAGQYVALQLRPEIDLPPIVRAYSISGANDDCRYRISVRFQGGPGSRFLHQRVRVGDLVDVSSPRGSFVLKGAKRQVVLLSAGIGATPLLAMLHSLVADNKATPYEVWWVHSARDKAHHVFAQEVDSAGSALSAFHRCVFYSRPDERDRLGSDFDFRGRVDGDALTQLQLPTDAEYYVCGPMAFMSDMRTALTALHVESSQIYEERFDGTARKSSAGPLAHTETGEGDAYQDGPSIGLQVDFVKSGVTARWNPRFSSLLELAEANNIPVKWSCRSGVCRNCECILLEGRLTYSPEPLDEPSIGKALICCATPSTAVRLDL